MLSLAYFRSRTYHCKNYSEESIAFAKIADSKITLYMVRPFIHLSLVPIHSCSGLRHTLLW